MEPKWEEYVEGSGYNVHRGVPVSIVDLLGDTIWIAVGNVKYLYYGGKVYTMHGKEVVKPTGYLRHAVESLNKLRETRTFGKIIQALETSRYHFTVTLNKDPSLDIENAFAPENETYSMVITILVIHLGFDSVQKMIRSGEIARYNPGSGGTIYWNPWAEVELYTQVGLEVTFSEVVLAHELAHAYVSMLGIAHWGKAYELGTIPGKRDVTKDEWYAVYLENLLRQEWDLPLRMYYTYKPDWSWYPEPIGEKMIRGGAPYLPEDLGKLLRLFYKTGE